MCCFVKKLSFSVKYEVQWEPFITSTFSVNQSIIFCMVRFNFFWPQGNIASIDFESVAIYYLPIIRKGLKVLITCCYVVQISLVSLIVYINLHLCPSLAKGTSVLSCSMICFKATKLYLMSNNYIYIIYYSKYLVAMI